MRLLAAVNTSLVLVGLTFLGMTWWAAFALNAFAEVTEPYFWHFYLGFSGVNLLFLGGLTVSAYLLARLRRTGLSVLAAVLVGELLYWGVLKVLWTQPRVAMSAAMATGVGNMGLGPQIFIPYPVTGLLAIAALLAFGMRRGPEGGASSPGGRECSS